ncbi:hypothetical protein Tco_1470798 [Tanacetum coccineum]
MTRSSTKELLSPFENPEQKFRSKGRLFDTPSLIESNSPEFDHIFDIKEQLEERERETMTETMEKYMSKTRENYSYLVLQRTLDSKGAIPSKTAADAKIAIQEMAEYSQKWHNRTSSRTRSTETSDGLAAIQA